ncbi:MAG: alpha/beta hydrolase family protein [Asticcacaulis sp.]|uniref:alpha/beta hydrolase family protein n=1 Tax=Asticcacaulis sp. TaxID=1872648 RepID=UPI003F7CB95D
MKKLIWMAAGIALLAGEAARAEDAAGDWAGVIAGQLHIVVHLTRGGDGKLTGSLESLDQGDAKIPLGTVDSSSGHLKFTVPPVNGSYEATWNQAKAQWTGTWRQGRDIPLDLHRAGAAEISAPRRPQEEAIAHGQMPYVTEQISFTNYQTEGVTLRGAFSKPAGAGPFPTVVLISGSGPNDRDENLLGHKLFLVLADYLNRQGLAVLRYDKRGVGESTGDYATATTADFISDALAATTYLKTRSDVDHHHVGLIGHSEGGLIAPAVAVSDSGVDFIVLMAGTGVRGDEVLLRQGELIERANGAPEALVAKDAAMRKAAFDIIESSIDPADARIKLKAGVERAVANGAFTKEAGDQYVAALTTPWSYSFLRYDPAPILRKVRVPVLAIGGSLDLQVEPQENLAAIKAALSEDSDVTVRELPGLNHLFQEAKTGSPAEFGRIDETLSPKALQIIADWCLARSGPKSQ